MNIKFFRPIAVVVVAFTVAFSAGAPSATASEKGVTAVELLSAIEKGEKVTLIDVRTPEEFEEGHIPGSVSVHTIKDLKAYRYEGKVILYCRSGVRSSIALETFAKAGVEALTLEGGIKAWSAAGGNVVTGPYKDISGYPKSFDIPKGVCETKEPSMEIGK